MTMVNLLLQSASLLAILTLPLLDTGQCDPDSIYWSENPESGAFAISNWKGSWSLGAALITYDSSFAHSGNYSTKLTINFFLLLSILLFPLYNNAVYLYNGNSILDPFKIELIYKLEWYSAYSEEDK